MFLSFSWLGRLLMSGRGEIRLYHPVFFYLALMIAFLDEVLLWVSQKAGRHLGIWPLTLSALFLLGVMAAMTLYLVHADPNFIWWEPLALTGFCVLLRLTKHAVGRLCYPNDE